MLARPLIVVTDFLQEPLDVERQLLHDTADVIAVDACSESDLAGQIEQAIALMVYHQIAITAETLNRLQNCRLIVRCGVGVDNVDLPLARKLGIDVANVPDYGTEEVADSAIAMTLGLTRGTHRLNQRLQHNQGKWSYTEVVPLQRLRGKTFGIVGFGRIGLATALRAQAHGFKIMFYDPYQPQGIDKACGIRRVESIEELAQESFVLSLHCPLTKENHHLIDADLLGSMPAGSYLINTARGGLVDPAALLQALETGRLAGAGIDVLEHEPPSDTFPLLQAWRDPAHPAYDRLLLNPHAAFYCEQGLTEMRVKGTNNCLRMLQGKSLVNVVN